MQDNNNASNNNGDSNFNATNIAVGAIVGIILTAALVYLVKEIKKIKDWFIRRAKQNAGNANRNERRIDEVNGREMSSNTNAIINSGISQFNYGLVVNRLNIEEAKQPEKSGELSNEKEVEKKEDYFFLRKNVNKPNETVRLDKITALKADNKDIEKR